MITQDVEVTRRILQEAHSLIDAGYEGVSHVVQVGVDTALFEPGSQEEARRELGLNPEIPIVLSPRSLSTVYNIDTILHSVPLVLHEIPDVCYIFKYGFGAGREAELLDLAEDLGISHAVQFVGFKEGASMSSYYVAADICLSVASSDSSPKSVLEAMACGTSTILSDLPWVHEHIHEGEEALLVPPLEPVALAAATVRLLRNPTLRAKLSINARQMVEKHGDYRHSMAEMQNLYTSLLSISTPQRRGQSGRRRKR